MIKRMDPDARFTECPCSIVAVGTAIGRMPPKPDGLREDGYLTLAGMNTFCRSLLPVRRMVRYKRSERPTLKAFLEGNGGKAIVCVTGHFLYADRKTYWSFLRNAKDKVIAAWQLN